MGCTVHMVHHTKREKRLGSCSHLATISRAARIVDHRPQNPEVRAMVVFFRSRLSFLCARR